MSPSEVSRTFVARQDAHLEKTGRANATNGSRRVADIAMGSMSDSVSIASRVSIAPSLHPSMAGTVISEACHPETVGAGDDTTYWDYQHRSVAKADLGHKCRECRLPFTTIGESLTERRGARVSMRYHAACFSGFADPRSQVASSTHVGELRGTQLDAAPSGKAGSKMRTSSHFDAGGRQHQGRSHGGGVGKTGMGLSMGSNGFGVRSSRGAAQTLADPDKDLSGFDELLVTTQSQIGARGTSHLSEEALRAHASGLDAVVEE